MLIVVKRFAPFAVIALLLIHQLYSFANAPKTASGEARRLIPFQGHLTRIKDNSVKGVKNVPNEYEPVPDGRYSIRFNLYRTPEGAGEHAWGPETHAQAVVVNGLLNVMIGSIEPLPKEADFFSRPLYVGITVAADDKGHQTEVELVPRQVLLPTLYAYEAGHAIQADNAKRADDATLYQGFDLFRKDGNKKVGMKIPKENIDPSGMVPTGTVVLYFGRIGEDMRAPDGWLVCDGTVVNGREERFAALYEAIGDTWGDGEDVDPYTINVPSFKDSSLFPVESAAVDSVSPGALPDPATIRNDVSLDGFAENHFERRGQSAPVGARRSQNARNGHWLIKY